MKSHEFIVEAEEVEEMTELQRKRLTMLKGKTKAQDSDSPQVKRKPSGPASQSAVAVAESDGGASCSSAIAAGPVPSLFKAPVKRVKETVSQSPVPKQKKARK
jgi:hypothetical protein